MALHHPIAYSPTFQQDLAIFYHQILCCTKKLTLLQALYDGYFSTWPDLTAKIITKYLPKSEITAKGQLEKQKERSVATSAANVTFIETKAGENKNAILFHLFDPTEKYII